MKIDVAVQIRLVEAVLDDPDIILGTGFRQLDEPLTRQLDGTRGGTGQAGPVLQQDVVAHLEGLTPRAAQTGVNRWLRSRRSKTAKPSRRACRWASSFGSCT